MRFFHAIFALFLITPILSADELRTLGGQKSVGDLKQITGSEVAFQTDAETITVPLSKVLAVDLREVSDLKDLTYTDVKLIDSTVLHCKEVTFTPDGLNLTLLSGTKLENVSLRHVVSILRDAQNKKIQEQWQNILKDNVKRDRIVALRDGKLNPLEGTLGQVNKAGDKIEFARTGFGTVELPIERVHAMIFYRYKAFEGKPLCRVVDTYGNPLTALSLSFDGKVYSVTTAFGNKLSLTPDVVAKLDFNLGKLVYLSDLEPAKIVERSNIGLVVRYRKDANLDGQPILLKDKNEGVRGLSMHAHTELEYELNGKYNTFKALVFVDPRVGASSRARVSIYCDGKQIYSQIATTKPDSIAVRVEDVDRLRIVVSSNNVLDLHDHATLAEARIAQ